MDAFARETFKLEFDGRAYARLAAAPLLGGVKFSVDPGAVLEVGLRGEGAHGAAHAHGAHATVLTRTGAERLAELLCAQRKPMLSAALSSVLPMRVATWLGLGLGLGLG